MRHVVTVTLVLAGLVHLLPLRGVIGSADLAKLYGVRVPDPDLELLLRHRAVLFGLLGAFLVLAAFKPSLHGLALTGAFLSAASFVVLSRLIGGRNDAITRVVRVDLVLLAILVLGALAHWFAPSQP